MASIVSSVEDHVSSTESSVDRKYEHYFLDVSSNYNLRVMLNLTQNEVNTLRELIIFQQDPNRINVRFRNNHHVNTILWINAHFDDKGINIFGGNYSTFNNHPSPSLSGPPILSVGNNILQVLLEGDNMVVTSLHQNKDYTLRDFFDLLKDSGNTIRMGDLHCLVFCQQSIVRTTIVVV